MFRIVPALLRHYKFLVTKLTSSDDRLKSFSLEYDVLSKVILAIDSQIGKLLPQWDETAQPENMYFYQKLSHEIMEIMNFSTGFDTVYIIDETVRKDKNSNVLPCLTHFVETHISVSVRFLNVQGVPKKFPT